MWNVTTSSWSTDIGFVENERYEFMQEAGYASGKSGGNKDAAFETLSTAFVSPYWDLKRGHVEFPMSAAVFTKNLGKSSSLIGPAIAGGGVAQWQASRTHFIEAKGIGNWSKTYSVLRSDKSYAVDSGFERSDVRPWTIKQGKFSVLDRNVLSETSHIDIQLLQESVSGSHDNATLNVSRNSTSGEVTLINKYSNEHAVSVGVAGASWEKEIFNLSIKKQTGALAKILFQEEYTASDKVSGKIRMDFLPLRAPNTLNVFDVAGDFRCRLNHHWKTEAAVERVNDVFTLEGLHALRTTARLSTFWRNFSVFEFGGSFSFSRADVQTASSSRKTVDELKLEPSGRWYWDHQIAFGTRMSWSTSNDKSITQGGSSRIGVWLNTTWPAVPEKKEL
jgi:hypothetical protein